MIATWLVLFLFWFLHADKIVINLYRLRFVTLDTLCISLVNSSFFVSQTVFHTPHSQNRALEFIEEKNTCYYNSNVANLYLKYL